MGGGGASGIAASERFAVGYSDAGRDERPRAVSCNESEDTPILEWQRQNAVTRA